MGSSTLPCTLPVTLVPSGSAPTGVYAPIIVPFEDRSAAVKFEDRGCVVPAKF